MIPPKKKTRTPKPSEPQSGAEKEVIKSRAVIPIADTRVLGKALRVANMNLLALVVLCPACGEGLRSDGARPDGVPVMTCACKTWEWGA